VQIAVLGYPGSWYCAELERSAAKRGHRATRVDFCRLMADARRVGQARSANDGPSALRELNDGGPAAAKPALSHPTAFDLTAVEAVIVRTMPPGSLEQVVFRMDALARLEAAGVIVFNPPKAIECAVDKYLTTARLAAAGLNVPETVVCEDSESALEAFARLGGDVVVKPLFGSEGRGIVRVSDPELALRTMRTLERIQAILYVQRYVDHEGFDVRALVLDDRVLGGIRRRCNGDFRANVSQNGLAEPYRLTAQEEESALRAAAATGARFAGVDLLYDRQGMCYVIEVNAVPGWRAFAKVTGCDVAGRVIEALEGS
jgi:ribosomal protein S6--L-glutamate ligase